MLNFVLLMPQSIYWKEIHEYRDISRGTAEGCTYMCVFVCVYVRACLRVCVCVMSLPPPPPPFLPTLCSLWADSYNSWHSRTMHLNCRGTGDLSGSPYPSSPCRNPRERESESTER